MWQKKVPAWISFSSFWQMAASQLVLIWSSQFVRQLGTDAQDVFYQRLRVR